MLIRGDRLNAEQRRLVLAAFTYRWTRENPYRKQFYRCPHCDLDNFRFESLECRRYHPTVSLQSDDEWLAEHAFHFVKDGSRLMSNRHHAELASMADYEEARARVRYTPGGETV